MKNPYIILEIKENATSEEIEQARKRQLKLQCGLDENKKNEEGEYLQEVINRAADDLLEPTRRKEIDESLKTQLPVSYDSTYQPPASIILTKINQELIEKTSQITLEGQSQSKKIKCNELFIVAFNNYSWVYAKEKWILFGSYLQEYFTKTDLTELESYSPWTYGEVFKSRGLLATAYPAYQILPYSIIQDGEVTEDVLRTIHPIIQTVTNNNREILDRLFQEAEEKVKNKK